MPGIQSSSILLKQKRERGCVGLELERSFLISSSLSHSKHVSEMIMELPYFNIVALYLYPTKTRQKSMS
ncbi:hypothetical protein BT93_L3253 [Corymbia citriodora subsp. variegata]|uniref:Uncharacterized protein n=1 Tax=Corymbia citriodora subsp. variegata TaxID=360336 RepID=A0A8T0CMB6_CORYI|nr:hypothetical protein BT93_L3253 [Corymbia citriodora subsp. variegata]